MDSRTPEERKVDEVIKDIKFVFNTLRNNIKDTDCVAIIKRLNNASQDAPHYKRDEIIPLLMNAYYYRVKINHQQGQNIAALEAARAFQALGGLDQRNYFYKFYMRYQEEISKLIPELEERSRTEVKVHADEKARQKEKAIKEKYFEYILAHWEKHPDKALEAGKKFLKLFKNPPKNDPSYKKVQDVMLAIHGRRVAQMKRAEQIRNDVNDTPAVRVYRSLETSLFPAPRTPNPPRITNSLNKSTRAQKPHKRVSKSLHLSGSGSSSSAHRKKK